MEAVAERNHISTMCRSTFAPLEQHPPSEQCLPIPKHQLALPSPLPSPRELVLEAENLQLKSLVAALQQQQRLLLERVRQHEAKLPATTEEERVPTVSMVIPRRKAGFKGTASQLSQVPVSITLEILEQLASHSLTTAAQQVKTFKGQRYIYSIFYIVCRARLTFQNFCHQLGISATAMKKACRKLGVTRWPYLPRKSANMGTLQMMPHSLQNHQDKLASVCSIPIPRSTPVDTSTRAPDLRMQIDAAVAEAMCEEDFNWPLPFTGTSVSAFPWGSAALSFKNSFVLETLALDLPFFDPLAENSTPPPLAVAGNYDNDWARSTSSHA